MAFEELSWAYLKTVGFYSIDVDTAPGAAFRLGVFRIPTAVLISNGMELERSSSVCWKGLRSMIDARQDTFDYQSSLCLESLELELGRPIRLRGLQTMLEAGIRGAHRTFACRP